MGDFFIDLEEHGRENDAVVMVFSEFGRRINDNGSGTDHGSGGVAFVMGESVKGGFYGEYPSLNPLDQVEGDMAYNNDFRGLYATLLDSWMGIDPYPVLGGAFEQLDMIKSGRASLPHRDVSPAGGNGPASVTSTSPGGRLGGRNASCWHTADKRRDARTRGGRGAWFGRPRPGEASAGWRIYADVSRAYGALRVGLS